MLSKEVFNDGIEKILIAFPVMEVTKERTKIWYETIKNEIDDYDWKHRVHNCIKNCQKTIPVLGDIIDSKGMYCDDYFRT